MNCFKSLLCRKTAIVGILTLLLLALGLQFYSSPVVADIEETYKNIEVFSNVLNLIQQNYVEEVDTQKLINGAIRGMLNSLDPHSSFLKPEDFKELQVETKGSFTGIGIEITVKDSVLTVVSPIDGTPAYQSGLQAGDRIVKIGNDSTKDMTLMEAVQKLRGPKGSAITISIFREGWTQLREYTLTRDVIPIYSVKSKIVEPGYGYIRITNFQANTAEDTKTALQKLIKEEKKLSGLILDLRNNPGGLLDQSVKVADIFLDEGMIVSTRGRLSNQNMTYEAHAFSDRFEFPMIILVNEGSASASEIVAGALKDHQRALVLGTQTFGKGSVQTIIPIPGGQGLRLTTARYYTPNGTSIQAKGIIPDIIVPSRDLEEAPPAERTKESKFIREKDLKHHIQNGNEMMEKGKEEPSLEKKNETEKQEPPAPDSPKGKDDGSKSGKTKNEEELSADQQLSTALLLLKGLNVFEEFSRNK